MTITRHLTRAAVMLLLALLSTTSWAELVQDAEGYYLIGTDAEWTEFANGISGGTIAVNAKAKLTADITASTMIGTSSKKYAGTFDGQGYTITANITGTTGYEAPFNYIQGATIKNLTVEGTINGAIHCSSLVGGAYGTNSINNIKITATITTTGSHCGGVVGHGFTSNTTIRDCLFSGTINGRSAGSTIGAIWGWSDGATANIFRCLENGSYTNCATTFNPISQGGGTRNISTTYYVNAKTGGNAYGLLATSEQLTSGEITYKLQSNRGDLVWGQTIATQNLPKLHLFDNTALRVYRTIDGYSNNPEEALLSQDSDGYFLIGTSDDWRALAMLVDEMEQGVNAKMTADIDLGDGQTMMGSFATPYAGIFDGQGHTLTINYDRTGLAYSPSMDYGAAPFLYIQNATIKNLHVDGSIHTSTKFAAGVVGDVQGTQSLIEKCRSSVNITSSVNGEGCMGGVVSHMSSGHTVIRDCLFDGSFDAPNAWGNGGIMGYKSGTATIENCLFAPTALSLGANSSYCIVRQGAGTTTISNCYYTQQLGTVQGIQATTVQLTNGRTAFYLQNGRTDLVWGQLIGTDPLPILTNDESKRVYRSATGYTNNPDEAIPDQSLQPFVYTRNANNELTITGFDPGFTPPANYTLVIPDDIDGDPVVYIANDAFKNKTNFTSLSIGRNVKTIGQAAFYSCTSMTSISLPADGVLETLNNSAFENCTNLVSMVLPNTVKTLGDSVLKGCTNLTSVTISNQLATIPYQAFRNCTHLNNVTIPSSVTAINNEVFWDCDALTSITIPNSVTFLGTNVFRYCGALESVTFAEGCQLTTIPNEVFRDCSSLTGITIPSSITTIGSSSFSNSALTSITFPANVTRINSSAFENCAYLTEVTVPVTILTMESNIFKSSGIESATIYSPTVGQSMFESCTKLEHLTLSNNVTTIGGYAFRYCSKLASVSIPSSVTTLNSYAFANCNLLETVTMAGGINITTLPDHLFYNDPLLASFTIPSSVTNIGSCAFENCNSLTSIVIPNNVTTLGDFVLKGCTNLESVAISNQLTTIPYQAFRNCTHLNNVVIPSSVTAINNEVFWDCDALTSITIPNNVTFLGTNAFRSCGALASVIFEEGCQLITIPNEVFRDCSSLTGITVPNSVTTIGESAFYSCTALSSVIIPSSVKTIGNSAFRYCTSLNNVVLHGGLTSIQNYSFANCTAMENLTIEEGVTSINRDVFQYSGMRNVVLPSTLGTIGPNLFNNCNQLEVLDVSKCVNVWELYNMTSVVRTGGSGQWNIFFGIPATTLVKMPPYAQVEPDTYVQVDKESFNLTQDGEGYYLINNLADWEKFAVYSRLRPTLNARLTADISLTAGNARLGIGNFDNTTQNLAYQGAFDGQRHTITVDFNFPNRAECLFMWVNNASIYRLKVAGTIRTQAVHTGGIIRSALGSITIEDCESAVNIIGTPTTVTNLYMGGFIGHGHNAQIYMTDCLFTGSITGIAKHRYASAFLGWMESAGRITYNYCLNNGTFTNLEVSNTYALGITQSNGQSTAVNCYYRSNNVTNNESLAQSVSDAQLESGYVTFRLQGTRPEQHWGQLLGTDLFPRLTDEEGTRVYRGQTYTNEPTAYTGLLQDEDGYYLIGGTADWEEFCIVVEELPLSNARMIADVEVIGNSMVGNSTSPYAGIFDGQGHTLTINYDRTGLAYSQSMDYGAAPFLFIQNATIKNLHVDGSIHTSTKFAAGVVGDVKGSQSLIENCRSSVNITSSVNGEGCMGGVVSHMTNGHTVFIRDCHFDGSFDAPNAWGNGGIMGYKYGTATIENCFFAPSALSSGAHYSYCIMRQGSGTTTINNCYYTQQLGSVQGTAATTEQLADGTIAYKLQANRTDMVWGQRIGTDPEPVLTNDESYRVYRSINGGYTNDPTQAYAGLQQDADGNYLIGSVLDWQEFAALVNGGTTTANAKMTADIDLGNDQTMVGSGTIENNDGTGNVLYQGIFDGQGHTLTIHYQTNEIFCAPFRHVKNATIKNLHVAGSINTSNRYAAGIVGNVYGQQIHSYVTNCVSSVNITSSYVNNGNAFNNSSFHGGIVARLWYYGQLHITDCLFSGSIGGENIGVTWGGMLGIPDGTVTIQNCLQAGTFDCTNVTSGSNGSGTFSTTFGSGYASHVNVSNCYYVNALGTVQGTQATPMTLADGTVTIALQANRTEEIWVQDPVTNRPMLKTFISLTHLTQDADGYYLLGSVQDWDSFATLVQTTPTANAKMTADIDLGDDQTMVGTENNKYQGTFDGQGHKLTIAYNVTEDNAAPFRFVSGANIRNLHVDGTINTTQQFAGGVVARAVTSVTSISNCWSSVNIIGTYNEGSGGDTDFHGGLVAIAINASTTIDLVHLNDCLFTGSIKGGDATRSHCANFIGLQEYANSTITNCLSTATYTDQKQYNASYHWYHGGGTVSNALFLHANYTSGNGGRGTQISTEQLADGTATATLNAGRTGDDALWVQDPVTNQPMLALFANTISFNGDGSEDNPFIITTTAELDYLASMVNSGENYHGMYFKLGADIAYDPNVLTIDNNGDGVNDSNYIPIGTGVFYYYNTPIRPSFRGIFDGDGHTISGIRIYREGNTSDDGHQGVFGFIQDFGPGDSFYAGIYNLWVADIDITGWINIGGIVGRNFNCIIENCHVASNVVIRANNQDDVCRLGGIVGYNETHGTVTRCSSAVTIIPSNNNSYYDFGGLAGYNEGTLTNNLVIGATIPAVNHPDHNNFYGAIAGSRKLNYSSLQHNYYSACTVGGVPNATNVGCGPLISENNGVCSDLYDNNGAVPGNVRTVAAPNVWISEDLENESIDGWAFIASPLTDDTDPESTSVENIFSATDYDLYRLNPSNTKWENWKVGDGNNAASGFSLENGRGYLYATQETDTIKFNGEADEFNLSDTTEVALSQGFNLVGNPFPRAAYINKPYYTLNADGSAVSTSTSTAYIPPCYGVVVDANEGETVTFTTTAPAQQNAVNNGNLQIAVSQVPELVEGPARDKGGVSTGSTTATLDNAIVSFNEGERLGKFYFGSQNANIYLPQNGKDYAIAYSDRAGEMPVNFKAKENGQYTITVKPEGVEMSYLHLIDNMTGADVDLLALRPFDGPQGPQAQGPASYTFFAKTTDYASRFKLVFVTNNEDGPSTGSGAFAFIDASGNIIITEDVSDAMLQVIDAMGRVLVCRDAPRASAIATAGMTPGVYVLRLINGDNVKTQKIIIK